MAQTEQERILSLLGNIDRRLSKLEELDVAGIADLEHDHSSVAEGGQLIDLNGAADALVLDADGDLTLSAPTDDQLDVKIGGSIPIRFSLSSAIFNRVSADIDFRIGSTGQASMFFVNAGNDRIGIGTAAPGSILEFNLATENLEVVDAGSASATEQDWVEVQVGNVTGYLRVFATK